MEFGLFWGDDVLSCETTKEPVIEGLLYKGDVLFITSKAGIGKSILALQLACCLTTGTPFLKTHKTTRTKVLYVQTEGDRSETVSRLKRISKISPLDVSYFYHLNSPGITLNKTQQAQALIDLLKNASNEFGVIILDPLYTTIKGSMSSDEVVTDWVREVRRLKDEFNSSMIVLHHEGKDLYTPQGRVDKTKNLDEMFGSTFWRAFVTAHYKMSVENDYHVLNGGKFRSGKDLLAEKIVMRMVEPDPLGFVPTEQGLPETTKLVYATLKSQATPMRRREIEDKLPKSKTTIWRALKELELTGLVEVINDDGVTYYKPKNGSFEQIETIKDEGYLANRASEGISS